MAYSSGIRTEMYPRNKNENTGWRKKNACFSNNCNFFIFNIKNYVNTETTCNKCSFDYLH